MAQVSQPVANDDVSALLSKSGPSAPSEATESTPGSRLLDQWKTPKISVKHRIFKHLRPATLDGYKKESVEVKRFGFTMTKETEKATLTGAKLAGSTVAMLVVKTGIKEAAGSTLMAPAMTGLYFGMAIGDAKQAVQSGLRASRMGEVVTELKTATEGLPHEDQSTAKDLADSLTHLKDMSRTNAIASGIKCVANVIGGTGALTATLVPGFGHAGALATSFISAGIRVGVPLYLSKKDAANQNTENSLVAASVISKAAQKTLEKVDRNIVASIEMRKQEPLTELDTHILKLVTAGSGDKSGQRSVMDGIKDKLRIGRPKSKITDGPRGVRNSLVQMKKILEKAATPEKVMAWGKVGGISGEDGLKLTGKVIAAGLTA